jgi:hypothetical protein
MPISATLFSGFPSVGDIRAIFVAVCAGDRARVVGPVSAEAGGSRGMGRAALVVIDMINTYEHEDADLLMPSVKAVLPQVVTLIRSARRHGVPVIYVNDNFGE